MRFFLLLSVFWAGLAQAEHHATVYTMTFQGKNVRGDQMSEGVTMPFVAMKDEKVAAAINDRLFVDMFGILAPPAAKTFGAAEGAVINDLVSQAFTLTRNDERILTIAFDNQRCAPACENYQVVHSFDIKTGRKLIPDELFTPSGKQELARLMHRERMARYFMHIKGLGLAIEVEKKRNSANSPERIKKMNDKIALAERCRTALASSKRTGDFTQYGLELSHAEFKLSAEPCSSPEQRALDEVASVKVNFAYVPMRAYLTPYGKAMLLNEGRAKAPATVVGQLLRGTVGPMPATMLLNLEGGANLSGLYFYEKSRTATALTGSARGKAITLKEVPAEGASEVATLRLTATEERLQGSRVGKQTQPVALAVLVKN